MPMWIISFDLSRALVCVHWPSLWRALSQQGISDRIISFLEKTKIYIYISNRANSRNQRKQQAISHETGRETKVCIKSSTILSRDGNGYGCVAWHCWQTWT